jgi:maltoporin
VVLAHILRGAETDPYFRSQVRLVYAAPGNHAFEGTDASGRSFGLAEAYAEGGNLEGSPLSYWIGRRFYRDVDLYIYDWYYFAEMSGNGAGFGNLPLLGGKVALAYFVQTGSTRTNLGQNAVQVLDARLFEVPVSGKSFLNFWAAFGEAPAGRESSGPRVDYVARRGWLGAIRWRRVLDGGFNDFTVGYGRDLLQGMNLWGEAAQAETSAPRSGAYRWRVVESLALQPSGRFGLLAGAAFEYRDPRTSGVADSRESWWSVGIRPVLILSKHKQLAFDAGHSQVNQRGERGSDGRTVGTRSLTRFTVAPQLALGPGIWDRPVLRAFYSYSFWDGKNSPYVGLNAPSFAGATAGQSLGFQAEVWF